MHPIPVHAIHRGLWVAAATIALLAACERNPADPPLPTTSEERHDPVAPIPPAPTPVPGPSLPDPGAPVERDRVPGTPDPKAPSRSGSAPR